MKSSRKGTRLNDAQYFKNPLPHTREKMTVMFLLENISNIKTRYPIDTEDYFINFNSRTSKNQGKKIHLMEGSIEMGLVEHDDGLYVPNEELSKEYFHEVYTETTGDLQRGSSSSSESIIIAKIERSDVLVAVDRIENDKEMDLIESRGIKRDKINDRHINRENKRHSSSKWRNSWIMQLIINLFSQMMGKSKKKDSMEMEEEEIIDVTRSGSYLVYRKEDNSSNVDDKSREEIVSTFVRQIQRTRDKNLRVMLLQRELQSRLPVKNTNPLKEYDEKLDTPRLSSPLC